MKMKLLDRLFGETIESGHDKVYLPLLFSVFF